MRGVLMVIMGLAFVGSPAGAAGAADEAASSEAATAEADAATPEPGAGETADADDGDETASAPEGAAEASQAGANTGASIDAPARDAADERGSDGAAAGEVEPSDVREGTAEEASASAVRRRQVAERLRSLLRQPVAGMTPSQVERRLGAIAASAGELAVLSDDAAGRMRALTVRMQALYRRIVEFPEAGDVPRWLLDLRSAARRAKAVAPSDESGDLAQPPPDAVGDYWLMLANLVELNRLELRAAAHRAQARDIVRAFLDRHAETDLAAEVRSAYQDLQPTGGPRAEEASGPEPPEAPESPETPEAVEAPEAVDTSDAPPARE